MTIKNQTTHTWPHSEATTWVVYRAGLNICSTVSIPQQLYKTASRGLSAIAELLVNYWLCISFVDRCICLWICRGIFYQGYKCQSEYWQCDLSLTLLSDWDLSTISWPYIKEVMILNHICKNLYRMKCVFQFTSFTSWKNWFSGDLVLDTHQRRFFWDDVLYKFTFYNSISWLWHS